MLTDPPIACSLNATQLAARLAEMRAVGYAALLDVAAGPGRAVLRFRADSATRARLGAIVAAEADCCAFMTLALHDEADTVVMSITAPAGAELVVEELLQAFANCEPVS